MNKTKIQLALLLEAAIRAGLTVTFVEPSDLHDYAAMNWKTARIYKITNFPINTIWVDDKFKMPGKTVEQTEYENIKHELDEAYKLQHNPEGGYWKAHLYALKQEKKPGTELPKPEGIKRTKMGRK